jgi:hypothetical protein
MARKESPVASRPNLFRRTDDGVPEIKEERDREKIKRIKRTFYLEPDLVLLLDEMQLAEHRQTGTKPELSNLVSEAIRLLNTTRQQEG